MTILAFLSELRKRLISLILAFVLASSFCYLIRDFLLDLCTYPVQSIFLKKNFIYTNVYEAFLVNIKVALMGGFLLSFPYFVFHLWGFLAPALYVNEKKIFWCFVGLGPLFFLSGFLLSYFLVIPKACQFFLSFERKGDLGLLMNPRIKDYVSFFSTTCLCMGLCFELPLVIFFLIKANVIGVDVMIKNWRIAVAAITVIAAIITPPDIVSMMFLMIPLILLYIITLFVIKATHKKRNQKENLKNMN